MLTYRVEYLLDYGTKQSLFSSTEFKSYAAAKEEAQTLISEGALAYRIIEIHKDIVYNDWVVARAE